MDGHEHARRAERLETLLSQLDELADAQAREQAQELVAMLLDLYGDALARIVSLAGEADAGGGTLIRALADDEVVGPLLLLHGLHPLDLEARITGALDEVRPYLRSHGGNVELLAVADGVAHLRLQGSCHGCPSSAMTLKLAIEEAIYKAAPDLDRLEVEGVAEPPPQLIALTASPRRAADARAPQPAGVWIAVPEVRTLAAGVLRAADVQGRSLVFCRAAGSTYAYANRCGGCAAPLDGGTLERTTLTCPACARRYDVAQAGRCLDDPAARLEPVPLLTEGGAVKVALPTPTAAPQAAAPAAR